MESQNMIYIVSEYASQGEIFGKNSQLSQLRLFSEKAFLFY